MLVADAFKKGSGQTRLREIIKNVPKVRSLSRNRIFKIRKAGLRYMKTHLIAVQANAKRWWHGGSGANTTRKKHSLSSVFICKTRADVTEASKMVFDIDLDAARLVSNIFISFVGAGILGLPYAFRKSGTLLKKALLVFRLYNTALANFQRRQIWTENYFNFSTALQFHSHIMTSKTSWHVVVLNFKVLLQL